MYQVRPYWPAWKTNHTVQALLNKLQHLQACVQTLPWEMKTKQTHNNHKQVSPPTHTLVWTSFRVCTQVQFQLERLCLNITRGQANKLLMISAFVQVNKWSNKWTLIEGDVLIFLNGSREIGSLSLLVQWTTMLTFTPQSHVDRMPTLLIQSLPKAEESWFIFHYSNVSFLKSEGGHWFSITAQFWQKFWLKRKLYVYVNARVLICNQKANNKRVLKLLLFKKNV